MRRILDVVHDVQDQVMLASSGSSDRPTSLFQAGSVGGERRPGGSRPAEGATSDVEERHRSDAELRRAAATIRRDVRTRPGAFRQLLATPMALRSAFVVSEVLGPPVALRDNRR